MHIETVLEEQQINPQTEGNMKEHVKRTEKYKTTHVKLNLKHRC